MATSKEIVSGVGVRSGVAFVLDTDTGLPLPPTTSPSPYTGIQIEGIKEYAVDSPAPQRITHYGDDRPYAQDSLPATEIASMTITTGKDNMTLDEALTGNLVVDYGGLKVQAEDTNNKGNEVQVSMFFYRQALDTTKGSATFGKLRQYNGRWANSARVVPQLVGGAQETVDQTYEVTLTPTTSTPYGTRFTIGTFGATEATTTKANSNQHPVWCFWRGNGVMGTHTLPYTPIDADGLDVWVGGTLTTPGSITFGSSPAFSLTTPAGSDVLVAACVQSSTQP